jgi:hypothetical protein
MLLDHGPRAQRDGYAIASPRAGTVFLSIPGSNVAGPSIARSFLPGQRNGNGAYCPLTQPGRSAGRHIDAPIHGGSSWRIPGTS